MFVVPMKWSFIKIGCMVIKWRTIAFTIVFYTRMVISSDPLVGQPYPSSPRANLHPTHAVYTSYNTTKRIEKTFTSNEQKPSEDRRIWYRNIYRYP